VAFLATPGGGIAHVVVTPSKVGDYVQAAQLARETDAQQLRNQIVSRSDGQLSNVVDAVYEDGAGSAATSAPQIILFIGGNLSGTSAGPFISSFTGSLAGAVRTSAGALGGDAACVPSVKGSLAECAWADNDTFGVLASPNMSEPALARELRAMRPLVEHRAR
jgi:hypothetical protein